MDANDSGNVYRGVPAGLPDEVVETLLAAPRVRIERIVSHGQCSAPGFWYDQDDSEWVLLLEGEAGLRFEAEQQVRHLRRGDYVNIPAHARHRVEWTRADGPTIWLAVFYQGLEDYSASSITRKSVT